MRGERKGVRIMTLGVDRLLLLLHAASLALVRDLDGLFSQAHSRSVLLCGNGTLLRLVLDESNTPTTGYQSDLAEALEAPENAGQSFDVVVFGKVLNKQNLVGREELVQDTACCRSAC